MPRTTIAIDRLTINSPGEDLARGDFLHLARPCRCRKMELVKESNSTGLNVNVDRTS